MLQEQQQTISVLRNVRARTHALFVNAIAQLLRNWCDQRPSNRCDLDSSVNGMSGKCYYAGDESASDFIFVPHDVNTVGGFLNGALFLTQRVFHTHSESHVNTLFLALMSFTSHKFKRRPCWRLLMVRNQKLRMVHSGKVFKVQGSDDALGLSFRIKYHF